MNSSVESSTRSLDWRRAPEMARAIDRSGYVFLRCDDFRNILLGLTTSGEIGQNISIERAS